MTFWLAKMGAEVTGFALPPDDARALYSAAGLDSICHSEIGDLRDCSHVMDVINRCRPQLVVHMAAQPLVRRSIADPLLTFSTNVMGTANLLDALRSIDSVTDILVVTSDKVYANVNSGNAFSEGANLGGHDPYSASKSAAEHVAHSYAATYFSDRGVRLATARAGNVIGGGDTSEDRIIPDCVRAIEAQQSLRVRHPDAVRPWQYVLDCLRGYLIYMDRLASAFGTGKVSQCLNFGPRFTERLTVGELISLFFRAYGQSTAVIYERSKTPIEMETLLLDPSRAEVELGWRCVLSQREAIAWTAAWYREVRGNAVGPEQLRTMMSRHIAEFLERTPGRHKSSAQ